MINDKYVGLRLPGFLLDNLTKEAAHKQIKVGTYIRIILKKFVINKNKKHFSWSD